MDTTTQQPPSCREVCDWLLDYLTPVPGDDWLTPEQRLAVDAHVKGCPACRKEMADMDRVVSGIRELGKIKIPEESINRMVDFAKKLEAQSRASAAAAREGQSVAAKSLVAREDACALKSRGTPKAARPNPCLIALWAGGGLAAAVAFLFFFLPQPTPPHIGADRVIVRHDDDVEPKQSIALEENGTVASTWLGDDWTADSPENFVRNDIIAYLGYSREMAARASTHSSTFWTTLAGNLETILAPDPSRDTTGELHAWLSLAQEMSGEFSRSQDTFFKSVALKVDRVRHEQSQQHRTEEEIQAIAQRVVLNVCREKLESARRRYSLIEMCSYTDALIARYPGTELESYGLYMVGEALHANGQDAEVVATCRRLAIERSHDPWSDTLATTYAASLVNIGQGLAAAEFLIKKAEGASDLDRRANLLYNAAVAALPPNGNLVASIKLYRRVAAEFPDTKFAKYAQEAIRRELSKISNG